MKAYVYSFWAEDLPAGQPEDLSHSLFFSLRPDSKKKQLVAEIRINGFMYPAVVKFRDTFRLEVLISTSASRHVRETLEISLEKYNVPYSRTLRVDMEVSA